MNCPFCKSDDITTKAIHGHTDHTCGGCGREFRDGQRYAKRLTVICTLCGPVEIWPRIMATNVWTGDSTMVEIEIRVVCPTCGLDLFAAEIDTRTWHEAEIMNAVENGDGDDSLIHKPEDDKNDYDHYRSSEGDYD